MAGQMLQVSDELGSGQILAQRFRLLHVVGEGGMGVVWAAGELATGRVVALKFLRDTGTTDPKTHQRFLREARAAMAVRHPNVATVSEVLETPAGAPFLVMDFLQGESLRERLRRDQVLSVQEVSRIMVPVTHAVEAAHAIGIVHRDIKPENIFLTKGDVRVLDFGIAKRLPRPGEGEMLTSLTTTGALIGTPYYMAPEQIFGDEDIDVRVDVWALGIVLYECLAGVRPTQGIGLGQILKIITNDQIRPLEQVAVHLPRDITQLVTQMLSRQRDHRPSLATVRRALEAYGPTLYGTPVPHSLRRGDFNTGSPTPVGPPPTLSAPPPGYSGPPPAYSSAPPMGYTPGSGYSPTLDTHAPASTGLPTRLPPEPLGTTQKGGGGTFLLLGLGGLGLFLLLGGGATGAYLYLHDTGTTIPTTTGVLTPPTVTSGTSAPPLLASNTPSGRSSAGTVPPRPSTRPTGPGPAPTTPVPTPTSSATAQPTRRAEWSAFTDRNSYTGPEPITAVRDNLPGLQSCVPAPSGDDLWSTSFQVFWPKAGGRRITFAIRKNNVDDASAEGVKMRSCLQAKADAWKLPLPHHDPDVGNVDSYVQGYAGYSWKAIR